MKRTLVVALAGAIFAVGLAVSGMTDPSKVIGFLDFTGAWNPSLALVMIGAIGVHASLRRLIIKRSAPLFAPTFDQRPQAAIDSRLIAGAAIFGIGWGLGGYCPGPAFVSATGSLDALLFVVAMTGGMVIHQLLHQRHAVAAAPAQMAGCDASSPIG